MKPGIASISIALAAALSLGAIAPALTAETAAHRRDHPGWRGVN